MDSIILEQYFLNISESKEKYLQGLISNILKNNNIIDFGAGTGKFTKLYSNKYKHILAIEIDEKLKEEFYINNNFDNSIFLNLDIKDFIIPENIMEFDIVSAPPYSLLKYINDKYIVQYNLKYILMVGENYLKLFKNYEIIYTFEDTDFNPKSTKKHYLITNIKKFN